MYHIITLICIPTCNKTIYIYREREREEERDKYTAVHMFPVNMYFLFRMQTNLASWKGDVYVVNIMLL